MLQSSVETRGRNTTYSPKYTRVDPPVYRWVSPSSDVPQFSMESEWVVLSSRMPNSSSADARDGILLPGVVDYSGLRFLL